MSAASQQNSPLLPAVQNFLSSPRQLLIDGELVPNPLYAEVLDGDD